MGFKFFFFCISCLRRSKWEIYTVCICPDKQDDQSKWWSSLRRSDAHGTSLSSVSLSHCDAEAAAVTWRWPRVNWMHCTPPFAEEWGYICNPKQFPSNLEIHFPSNFECIREAQAAAVTSDLESFEIENIVLIQLGNTFLSNYECNFENTFIVLAENSESIFVLRLVVNLGMLKLWCGG